jgi:hypothetical protein
VQRLGVGYRRVDGRRAKTRHEPLRTATGRVRVTIIKRQIAMPSAVFAINR